jgi:hypothetical protein
VGGRGTSQSLTTLLYDFRQGAPSPLVNRVSVKRRRRRQLRKRLRKRRDLLCDGAGPVEPVPVDSPLALLVCAVLTALAGSMRLRAPQNAGRAPTNSLAHFLQS